jgi:hypothetical protein
MIEDVMTERQDWKYDKCHVTHRSGRAVQTAVNYDGKFKVNSLGHSEPMKVGEGLTDGVSTA